MWSTSEIKERGKAAFKLNYWKCVIVSFLLSLTVSGTSSLSFNQTKDNDEVQQAFQQMQNTYEGLTPGQQIAIAAAIAGTLTVVIVISVALRIFLFNPLKVGCLSFFKKNDIDPPADFNEVSTGFRNYLHTFATLFLNDLFLTLWSLLLIVPGLIKSYSYRMVPYILADEPDLSPTDTITRSRQMMDGHKWHAFCYDLSFIGWMILTIITCGIVGMFWYSPYKNSSDAALYLALRDGGLGYPEEEPAYTEPVEPAYLDLSRTSEAEPAEPTEPEPSQPEAPEDVQPEAPEDIQPTDPEEGEPTDAE